MRACLSASLVFLAVAAIPAAALADVHWVKARFGAFEAISDDGRKPATQALSEFEQFSYALASVMGTPAGQADLRLDPPLRIIVFKNDQELQAQCGGDAVSSRLRTGRDRLMACTTGAERQLPASLLRDLTRLLLQNNFVSVPGDIGKGIETFFSTVQSTGVRVTWGAPPARDERTREWALVHMIVTQPEYTGKAKIYLHNLASGMDKNGASMNAFGEEDSKFEAEVDSYFRAGVFNSAPAPARALNPDRDLNTTVLTSDEGELMKADLLTPGSDQIYKSLLKAGKHLAEANEGLAVIAMQAGDEQTARGYMAAARDAGTKNVVVLTAYADDLQNTNESIEILKEALTIDPKYAEAHWVLGEKLRDPARRMAEWKQAVALAPQNGAWLSQYAQLCMDWKQYAEAGRAWMAAAQAAPDAATRDKYLALRSGIEEKRLAAEDAERRKEAAEKAAELNNLKNEAKKHLAELEAKANSRPLSADPPRPTVDWYDTDAEAKLAGTLVRVDCTGKQFRLQVKDESGKTQSLLVRDPAQLVIQGAGLQDGKSAMLSCGVQRARHVEVAYRKSGDTKAGFIGEATGIEFDQ